MNSRQALVSLLISKDMKTRSIIALIVAAALALVVSCVKELEEMGVSEYTEYIGTVVEKSTMQPIEGVKVQVTDGTHVHASTETDKYGKFNLKEINFEEVNNDYYLWLDGSALDLPSAQEELQGLGREIYDYKTLILYDKTNADLLPKVSTGDITDLTALSVKVKGTVTADGDHEVSVRGVCYAIHQTPTLEDSIATAGAGLGSYTCALSGLTKATTYYVRTYATNNIGTVYGAQKTFTTKDGKATITTSAATEIKHNSAIVGGSITDDGGDNITARGVCWGTSENPSLTNDHTTDGVGTGSYTHKLQELESGTTYYYRAYATNSCGTTYGAQKSFTTTNGLPVLTTTSVTDVTATSAKCGGNITDNGGFTVTARGICWNTVGNPDTNDTHTASGAGNGTFSINMTNLNIGTTYYVRAYAVNQMGVAYGNAVTFTTGNGMPVVTTYAVTSITAESAVCSGDITSDGGFPITAKGFCWSTNQYPTINEQHNSLGTGTGTMTSSITGLTRSTTYYVRAYATNAQGTSYGPQKSFTTASGLPTVTTTAVTMNGTQAVSGGNVTSDGGYPVTARGICYGTYPNPDLTAAYTHTSNGTGTGYFSSVIDGSTTGTIYVRAYATNANGTSYGNQITVNYDYLALPTFTYGGHTYKVAPNSNNRLTWSDADNYCNNLTYLGYSDWRMPTQAELLQMYNDRALIGGFVMGSSNNENGYYWSSTSSGSYHYVVDFYDGTTFSLGNYYNYLVRPIRVDH